jgi:hypothetical protein
LRRQTRLHLGDDNAKGSGYRRVETYQRRGQMNWLLKRTLRHNWRGKRGWVSLEQVQAEAAKGTAKAVWR